MNILITEKQIKKLLNNNLLIEYSKSLVNKLVEKFQMQSHLDKKIIVSFIIAFEKIKDNPKIIEKDITKYDWEELRRIVISNKSKRIKAGKINDGEPSSDANLIYNQNGLRIYLGKTKDACIKYGNGYKFCISSRGNLNQYNIYRFEMMGTPYFIFDDTKTSKRLDEKTFVDPEHLLVLIIHEEGYYTITEANNDDTKVYDDFESISNVYPKLKSLKNIFRTIELTEKEYLELIIQNIQNELDKINNECGIVNYAPNISKKLSTIESADMYIDELYKEISSISSQTENLNDLHYCLSEIIDLVHKYRDTIVRLHMLDN